MMVSTTSRRVLALAGTVCVGAFGVAACGSDDDSGSSSTSSSKPAAAAKAQKVAVLLPDTKSSTRWETQDRPLLAAAFKKAGVPATIQNAQGDKSTQQQQAEQAITNGAKILLITNLDNGSGAAIHTLAKNRGVKVIDYDRLTLGGSADYYVSFDNVGVGKLQGEGLVKCLDADGVSKPVVAEVNGSPDDNNATLFAQGYNSVLDPLYASGKLTKGPNQAVPEWDNQKGLQIFEQMLQQKNNKIDGVLAANDGLGNSVISALKARKLKQIPVTGQDASLEGIQNIVAGDQCMTVYKNFSLEADAAAKLVIAVSKGTKPESGLVNGESDNQKGKVPSVLLTPVAVTTENINDTVVKDGLWKKEEICAGKFAAACTKAGI